MRIKQLYETKSAYVKAYNYFSINDYEIIENGWDAQSEVGYIEYINI